jgi:hypothetical protein
MRLPCIEDRGWPLEFALSERDWSMGFLNKQPEYTAWWWQK